MEYVTKLASVLHLYRPEHLLCAEYLHEQYDPELVRDALAHKGRGRFCMSQPSQPLQTPQA